MDYSFRSEVFNLCKKIASSSNMEHIKTMIRDMKVMVRTTEDGSDTINKPPHGDLSYIATHQRIQFLGYLFADESVEDINKNIPFSVTCFDDDERVIMENAYYTIRFFINSCISEINNKYPKLSILIDPYSQYRKPALRFEPKSLLSEKEIEECVKSFRSGKLYKKIMENEALELFDRVGFRIIHQLIDLLHRQYTSDMELITNETQEFYYKILSGNNIDTSDVLMMYTTYCYALRQSLGFAIQMMYEAIIGLNMIVMNNDNIINIVDNERNIVYEKYVVLTQDTIIGITGTGIGSIALLTCEPNDNYNIKKFGEIISSTVNFGGEFGSSTKVTIISVDEELNPIHQLTDALVKTPLGQSPIKYHRKQ